MEGTLLRVREVTAEVLSRRVLDRDVQAAWQVLHGVLAYGNKFEILVAEQRHSATEYLLAGGQLEGWRLEAGDALPNGRTGVRAIMESGSFAGQGHADQWLAVLSQAEVTTDRELQLGDNNYLIEDYLGQVLLDVPYNSEREYSWTLIALTRYLPTDSHWIAGDGKRWSIEQLVRHEVEQELHSSTCGGTHRLIGIAMALGRYAQGKNKVAADMGVWATATDALSYYAELAQRYQNVDGSFSTNYFRRPGISADNAEILATTGHTLEFLALSLSAKELQAPWILAAVQRLCLVLEESSQLPLECGALYHAVHGLVVFEDKLSGSS